MYRFIKADALYDSEGNSIGIMIIINDVTENKIIKESFSRYVAHQVVERILNGTEKVCLNGIQKEVTVLFADIRGFTSLSERCDPEKVVFMLNKFFSLMVDVIFKYEGTLDKFIGDNIIAIFAALEMQENIEGSIVTANQKMKGH